MSQTPASTPTRLRLTIKTGDSQSEILILDARSRLIERLSGPVAETDLEPGIYRVKVITGTEAQERALVLTDKPHELTFAPAAFATPLPLVGTSTSHEYHAAAAANESRKTHVADGEGSSLFFLVRDWTPDTSSTKRRITDNPATGLSLHAVMPGGERKLCDLATAGTSSLDLDPWSACTIDVSPGVYELRLALPSGATLAQTFVASPGWQSQAFIFMRGYRRRGSEAANSSELEWRADLSRTSVLLARGKGFSPNERLLRLAELARVSLGTFSRTSQRRLLPEELRTLLRQKFDNPMLGIYGAHLLLLETSFDQTLFNEVVRNLRGLLGAPHPDVEALALRAIGEPPQLPFAYRPMLARSWALIVDASVTNPALVTQALSDRCVGNFLMGGPWLIQKFRSDDAPLSDDELSELELALAEDVGVMQEVRRAALAIEGTGGFSPDATGRGLEGPGAEAGDVLQSLPARPASASQEFVVELDTDRLRSLATRFGLPNSQLRNALSKLEAKITQSPQLPNLKVVLKD